MFWALSQEPHLESDFSLFVFPLLPGNGVLSVRPAQDGVQEANRHLVAFCSCECLLLLVEWLQL